jgi:hypothetical protein
MTSLPPRSTELRILRHLLRLAPYATSALQACNRRALVVLHRRGLVAMDAWGVVSLTHRGERVAMNIS